ncbi:MAG TPA: ACP S-malonyltransferase [Candidatus Omnitrophota bacterium]|nr:ACP S-malonyltransferase [Candidatus Omnitrophota bacterium]
MTEKRIGFLFPGQGSQFVGMGLSLFNQFDSVKAVFKKADDVLGYSISQICFEGPEDVLTQTLNAQPAIYVCSYAALTALKEKWPSIQPAIVAGHSLGEFSALAAAGFFSFEDGLRLVQVRARAMEKAASQNPGAMAAILGLDQSGCIEVAKESGAEVANFNAPSQTVLTGTAAAIQKSLEIAEKKGAKRAIQLKVSGAFHSTLMKQAQADLVAAIQGIKTNPLAAQFIPNVTGKVTGDTAEICDLLGRQLVSSVCWTETMAQFSKLGLTHLIEVGPGKVLKGLAKSCEVPLAVQVFGTAEDVEPFTLAFLGSAPSAQPQV